VATNRRKKKLVDNSLKSGQSYDTLRECRSSLLNPNFAKSESGNPTAAYPAGIYVQDLFEDSVIYSMENQFYRIKYKQDPVGGLQLEGTPQKVTRVIGYEPTNNVNVLKENEAAQLKVVEVLDNHFIYQDGDRLFRRGFAVNESGEASLTGNPTPVNKVVKYVEDAVDNDGGRADQEGLDEEGEVIVPDGDEEEEESDDEAEENNDSGDEESDVADESSVTNSQQGEPNMALNASDKKRIVDDLIGNCGECGWTERDRETLNAMKDEALVTMDECRKKMATTNQKLKTAEEEAVAAKAQVQQLAANQSRKLTDQEWMEQAPLPVRRVVANAQAIEAQEKGAIINRLVANISDEAVRKAQIERLQLRDINDLRADLALLPAQDVAVPAMNYLGMAPAFNQSRADDVDPNDILEMPTTNWSQQK
jgi:hypothetical protein